MKLDTLAEKIAKEQAKTLLRSLEMLQTVGSDWDDSELIALNLSLEKWLNHVI